MKQKYTISTNRLTLYLSLALIAGGALTYGLILVRDTGVASKASNGRSWAIENEQPTVSLLPSRTTYARTDTVSISWSGITARPPGSHFLLRLRLADSSRGEIGLGEAVSSPFNYQLSNIENISPGFMNVPVKICVLAFDGSGFTCSPVFTISTHSIPNPPVNE